MTGTPQARKLGLKAGLRVDLDLPPDGWALTEPPAGLLAPDEDGAADVILAFFRAADLIPGRLPGLAERIFPAGAVWALWPRRAGGHDSDITDSVVRGYALDLGLVDVKVAAVDEDWSGLRLVWRTANRGGARVGLPAPLPASVPVPRSTSRSSLYGFTVPLLETVCPLGQRCAVACGVMASLCVVLLLLG